MKVTDILKSSAKPFPSLEFVPPLKESDINVLYSTLDPLMEFQPPYVNITCHRNDTKHPSTVATTAAIMRRYKSDVVPHIIWAGNSRQDISNELFDLSFLGVENIMALRGDDCPCHADSLVSLIDSSFHEKFCIGVAGYPETHKECVSLDEDIRNLKHKVDCGADYIITQMFFDNSRFYNFVKLCRSAGITVPIIPGIKPLANKGHLEKLPESFSIEIPEALSNEIRKCRDDAEARAIGIEWCTDQTKDLLKNGAPAIHFYTMSRGGNILEILKKSF